MCWSIDLEDPDVLKDFYSVFIGAMTKQHARDSDIIENSECNWHLFFCLKDTKLR